jgi:hypothetical protein
MDLVWLNLLHGVQLEDCEDAPSGLLDVAGSYYHEDLPEVKLIWAIIIAATKDKDVDFFNSEEFKGYCFWIRCSHSYVREVVNCVWELECQ